MTDRYAHIREALEALDAAGGDWISWETAFLKYAKASQPDTIRALLAERDALREALEMMVEMVEMNGFGRDYAMDVARAALSKENRNGSCTREQNPQADD